MKRKKRNWGVLMIATALIIMQLPVSEADAATSASDFKMEGSALVRYRGNEKNVSIPDTVQVIREGAFEENDNVELVVVPNSVKTIESYAFWGCDSLDTVVLGNGLREVGDYAFAGCTGLEQMTIPSNVKSIGILAFGDCYNMKNISIPAETSNIHDTAFDGCYQLTIHCDPGSAADTFAAAFYERQKEMPEKEDAPDKGEPSIPEPSGTGEPAVTEAPPTQEPVQETGNLLGSTHVVGNNAVVFVDNKQERVYDGDTSAAVRENPGLTDLREFDWNSGVPKYTIVDGTSVADWAYYKRTDLDTLALPEGVRQIGQFAFSRSALKTVVLPEGVEEIAYGAFYHCDALESAVIPATVRSVEPKAFTYTPWVERFLKGEAVEGALGDFLISGGVLVAYRGNARELVIPEGVRVIGAEVFQGHEEIESVSLPESLLVAGEGAFEGCSRLNQVKFGQNLQEIKDRAFFGTGLQGSITLPASLQKLGLFAFGNIALAYEGQEPEHTHETSAARLSNMAYRGYEKDATQVAGVKVEGLEGAEASLQGADRSYTLTIGQPEDGAGMKEACQRTFQVEPPDDMAVYSLSLSDGSGIPLTKLGNQPLTVVLPLPEALKGQEVKVLAVDRNGQLDLLEAERVLLEGAEAVRFVTTSPSVTGVLGVGPAESQEELLEVNVKMEAQSGAPVRSQGSAADMMKLLSCGILLTAGTVLWAGNVSRNRKIRR